MFSFKHIHVLLLIQSYSSIINIIPADGKVIIKEVSPTENLRIELDENSAQPSVPGEGLYNEKQSNMVQEQHTSDTDEHFDTSMHGGYYAPTDFQQYLQQMSTAIAPYILYPPPYAMPNGYDSYFKAQKSLSTTVTSNFFNKFKNAFAALYTTFYGGIITVAVTFLVILMGGAVTSAICNMTPICTLSSRAFNYFRGTVAGDMGRMLVEEMTPERVRRAAEFVYYAINKFETLQKQLEIENNK